MIAKPAVSFLKTYDDAHRLSTISHILTCVTDNVHYPDVNPPLSVLNTACDEYGTAIFNAADGGKMLNTIKYQKRQALCVLIRQLANYVASACQGDLMVLQSSGFPTHKTERSRVGALQPPGNLKVVNGWHEGELDASASPRKGASIYNWQVCTAADPTIVVQTAQTTGASNTFTGLTPGVKYLIQINAGGAAGASDWSNPIPRMAM